MDKISAHRTHEFTLLDVRGGMVYYSLMVAV